LAQPSQICSPFVGVGPEKGQVRLARDIARKEVHISVAHGLDNATGKFL
jgi:hypothetical protein